MWTEHWVSWKYPIYQRVEEEMSVLDTLEQGSVLYHLEFISPGIDFHTGKIVIFFNGKWKSEKLSTYFKPFE